jgi:DNA-binding NarL/FixJ family response regulator
MKRPISILHVEDDPQVRGMTADFLNDAAQKDGIDIRIEGCETLAEAMALAAGFDVVLLDLGLPDSPKEATLKRLPEITKDFPPVIVVSAYTDHAGEEPAIYWDAIRFGAVDVHYKTTACADPHGLLLNCMKAISRRKYARF